MSTQMPSQSSPPHAAKAVGEMSVPKWPAVIVEEVTLARAGFSAEVDPQGVSAKRSDDPTLSPQSELTRVSTEAIEYRGFRSLIERANEVFGDQLKASLWLSTPSNDLEGKVPMQVAQAVHYSSVELERIFEPIFIHIEHGIYT